MMDHIAVRAHAKLTLALHVTATREDGYHDLDAIVVSVSAPSDVVTLTVAAEDGIVVTGPAAGEVPADGTNLAARAIAILRDHAFDLPPVRITLEKEIPAGAGLGGGSADAAAVLWAARAAFGLDLDDAELQTFGEQLGSDVPVCLVGGMTNMSGRGERVEPLPWSGPFGVVTVVPPFRLSTPDVYRAWDALDGPMSLRLVHPIEGGPGLRNDLEPAAEAVDPRVAAFREAIAACAGIEPVLAGSGSAYACCVPDFAAAQELAERLERCDPQWRVFAGAATPTGVVPL